LNSVPVGLVPVAIHLSPSLFKEVLLEPLIASNHRKVDTFLNPIVEFLPKLILFIVILVVGFIVARLVKAAITKALQAAGIDRAPATV